MEPGSPPLPDRARSSSGSCPAAVPALDARDSTILGTTACAESLFGRTYAAGAGACCYTRHTPQSYHVPAALQVMAHY